MLVGTLLCIALCAAYRPRTSPVFALPRRPWVRNGFGLCYSAALGFRAFAQWFCSDEFEVREYRYP